MRKACFLSDNEDRDIDGVTLQLAKAFAAFNKSADKLSTAYKQLLDKGDSQEHQTLSVVPYIHSLTLLEDRRLLLGALESMPGGVIIVDHECRAVFLSVEAQELAGSGSGYAEGGLYSDVFQEVIADAAPIRYRKCLSPDVEVEIYAAPVADEDGNVIGAVGIVTDSTEKDDKISIQEAPSSTIAPVLTAIGDIIINIAHQMRSPLSAIQLFAELLRQDLDQDKHEIVDDILVGVHSLDAVLSNLLSFSQSVGPSFQEMDLIAILDESLLFAESAMRQQDISLVKEYSHNELYCSGDLEQLKQVCLNLILNAIQAMPEGGELRVNASYVHEPSAKAGGGNIDGYINVTIADNGSGVPEEAMGRIFTPFFTTKEGSTGLGLCIVYRVMQAHHGSIQINSNSGYGTTASIQLPAYRLPEKM